MHTSSLIFLILPPKCWNRRRRGSSISWWFDCGLDDLTIEDRFPSGVDTFLFATESTLVPKSKQLLNRMIEAFFAQDKAEGLQLTTHLHLVPKVKTMLYRHSSYAVFASWRFNKYKENFTFCPKIIRIALKWQHIPRCISQYLFYHN